MSNPYDIHTEQSLELLNRTSIAPSVSDSADLDWGRLAIEANRYWAPSAAVSSVIAADPITDDYAADTSTTGVVAVNGSVTGLLETSNDRDWFRVNLTGDKVYAFDLKGAASGSGTLLDPGLQLLNVEGEFVAFDHDSGVGSDSQLRFSPLSSGAYYLSAQDVGISGGSYSLV
jgi:hypothetical protein